MQTSDNVEITGNGQRLFNYYDCKWGTIQGDVQADGWFTFVHDDGTKTLLNGERVSSVKPSWMK